MDKKRGKATRTRKKHSGLSHEFSKLDPCPFRLFKLLIQVFLTSSSAGPITT